MDLGLLERWHQQKLVEPMDFSGITGWRILPQNATDVAICLKQLSEAGLQVAMHPQDAAGLDLPIWMDMSALHRIRQHPVDDFIIEVETGMPWGELIRHLAAHKQAFGLSYPDEEMILHALADDRPALETGQYPRDRVLKVEIATPDGKLTISGADVVKNVTGYDLGKLYIGGQHAFGVITSVTLKLSALPAGVTGWLFSDTDEALLALSRTLINSALPVRVCELFREQGRWQLYVEVLGDATVQEENRAVLAELTAAHPDVLSTDALLNLRKNLQVWPPDAWVLGAALPLGQLAKVLASELPPPSRIRPTAGLVYWQSSNPALSDAFIETIRELDGFAQWVQTPGATDSIERLNLPQADSVRGLLQTLKSGYDPNNTLYSPRLVFAS